MHVRIANLCSLCLTTLSDYKSESLCFSGFGLLALKLFRICNPEAFSCGFIIHLAIQPAIKRYLFGLKKPDCNLCSSGFTIRKF